MLKTARTKMTGSILAWSDGLSEVLFVRLRTLTVTICTGALATSILVTGCQSKRSQQSVGLEAVDVTGSVNDLEMMANWSVPLSRRVNFYLCLNDDHRHSPATPGEFEVRGGPARVITSTNQNGCLNWVENYTFNAFAQPTYLEIHRTIVGLTEPFNKGEVTVRIGVNPWSGINGSEPAVVFLDRAKVPRLVALGQENAAVVKGTDENNVEVNINQLSGFQITGLTYQPVEPKISFTISPKLRLKSMTDGLNPVTLTEGDFNLQLQIYRERDNELMMQSETFRGRLMSGAIRVVEANLRPLKRFEGDQDVYWAKLILMPREPFPAGLGAVSAKCLLKTTAQDFAGNFPCQNTVADALKSEQVVTMTAPQKADADAGSLTYRIADLAVTSQGVFDVGQQRRRLDLAFAVEVTTSPNIGTALLNRKFLARRFQPKPGESPWKPVETTAGGVLKWTDDFEFSYYGPRSMCGESAKQREVDIEIIDPEDKSVSIKRRILINPWAEKDTSLIADMRTVGSTICASHPADSIEGQVRRTRDELKPYLQMTDQTLTPIESQPVLRFSKSLDISAKYKLTYTGNPVFYFPDDPLAPGKQELPRPGFYRLTLVIMRPNVQGDEMVHSIVSSTQTVFSADQTTAQMNQILELELDDPLLSPVRNWALVQFEFVDEDSVEKDSLGRIDLRKIRVLPDQGIIMPAFGFQIFVNQPSSETTLSLASNFKARADGKIEGILAALWESLKEQNLTVPQLHEQYQAQRAKSFEQDKQILHVPTLAKELGYRYIDARPDSEGLKVPGLEGLALRSALPSLKSGDVHDLKEALDCMHEVTYGHWRHQWAKCLLEKRHLIEVFQRAWCNEPPRQYKEEADRKHMGSGQPSDLKPPHFPNAPWLLEIEQRRKSTLQNYNARDTQLLWLCRGSDFKNLRELFWVEKRFVIEDYSVDEGQEAGEVLDGYQSDFAVMGISNVSSSYGTLLQHESMNRLKARVEIWSGELGIVNGIGALWDSIFGATKVMKHKITEGGNFLAGKGWGSGAAGTPPAGTAPIRQSGVDSRAGVKHFIQSWHSVGVSWKLDMLYWWQRFMVGLNGGTILNRVGFSVEQQNVVYSPKRYRECYFVHGTLPPSGQKKTRDGNIYADSNWNKLRDLICFPVVENKPIQVLEKYFTISQVVQSAPIGFDARTNESVMYFKTRGERDFHLALQIIEDKFGALHYNRLPTGVIRTLRRAQILLDKMRQKGAPKETIEAAEQEIAWFQNSTRRPLMAIEGMIAAPQPPIQNYEMFGDINISDKQSEFTGWSGFLTRFWNDWVGMGGSGLNPEEKDVLADPENQRHRSFYIKRQSGGN